LAIRYPSVARRGESSPRPSAERRTNYLRDATVQGPQDGALLTYD